jgi:hypothetical protein
VSYAKGRFVTIAGPRDLSGKQKNGQGIVRQMKMTGETPGDRQRAVYARLVKATADKYREAAIKNGVSVKDKF